MPRDVYQRVAALRDSTTGFLQALAGIKVSVFLPGTTTLATIYQASTGTTQGPIPSSGASGGPNPFNTGVSGAIEFFADSPAEYDVKIEDTIVPARITTVTYRWPAQSTADNSIPAAKLVDLSIPAGKIADNAITSSKIIASGVATTDIADGAVTLAKHAANSVDSSKIVEGSIASGDIADGAISAAKIPNDVLTLAKLALGHGMGFAGAGWGGNAVETEANTSDVLATVGFTAKTSRALVIALGDFLDVRGGIGFGALIADISGVSGSTNAWPITAGWGGWAATVHQATGLTPGAGYTARAISSVANEPVTMKCRGNATLIVFDLAD